MLTLLQVRTQGRLAHTIFFPPSIQPDLRAMFNPEYLRLFGRDGKRKRTDDNVVPTPKKARISEPEPENPFNDGLGDGFADGLGENFGDGGFGENFGENTINNDPQYPLPRNCTVSPSLVDDAQGEEEEAPTSLTRSLSHSTVAAAPLLQKELAPGAAATLDELTANATSQAVRREVAVKMFFEVLVLASRDVIRVQQGTGFGDITVRGKEGLFQAGGFG